MAERSYTPRVRAEAAALGVDLTKVPGTGVGNRVSLADVREAAGAPRIPIRNEAPARRQLVAVVSAWDPRRTIQLDVYGPNPLVEDARQTVGAFPAAARSGPPPTLFADGDVPSFTASGVDPRELLKVPWYARHAVAAAQSPGTVLAAIEHFAQTPDDWEGTYQHWGAEDYKQRVHAWLVGPPREEPKPAGWDEFLQANGLN